jgi:hypothetical protein
MLLVDDLRERCAVQPCATHAPEEINDLLTKDVCARKLVFIFASLTH